MLTSSICKFDPFVLGFHQLIVDYYLLCYTTFSQYVGKKAHLLLHLL